MPLKNPKGIRFEIALNITFLSVFALALSAAVIFIILERYLIPKEIESSKLFVEGVRKNLEYYILNNKTQSSPNLEIQKFVNRMANQDEIKTLIVTRYSGKIIAQFDKVENEQASVRNKNKIPEIRHAMITGQTQLSVNSNRLKIFNRAPRVVFSAPIFINSKVWGGIYVEFQLKGLSGLSPSVFRYFLIYLILVAVILAGFSATLMEKYIVKPVLNLVQGTRKIRDGDLSARVLVQTDNELGELGKAFNEMASKMGATQKALIQREKLAMVGRLSAGVAHEIGNPIGAILGYVEILKNDENVSEQTKDFCTRIANEGARIDRIIRDLLEMSRPVPSHHEHIDLVELCQKTMELVAGQALFKQIEVEIIEPDKPILMECDTHKFQQILVNLLTNASMAMDQKGTLTIIVKSGIFNEYKHIEAFAGADKNQFQDETPVVVVQIQDSGPGIQVENLSEVFEPFFTTRDPGEGSGLGLYIVAGWVESMNGFVGIENVSEGGCRVSLVFLEESTT